MRAAVDLVEEGAIDRAEALTRVTPEQLATVLAPRVSAAVEAAAEVVARGIAACPGVAAGIAIGDSDAAARQRATSSSPGRRPAPRTSAG